MDDLRLKLKAARAAITDLEATVEAFEKIADEAEARAKELKAAEAKPHCPHGCDAGLIFLETRSCVVLEVGAKELRVESQVPESTLSCAQCAERIEIPGGTVIEVVKPQVESTELASTDPFGFDQWRFDISKARDISELINVLEMRPKDLNAAQKSLARQDINDHEVMHTSELDQKDWEMLIRLTQL